MKKLIQKWLGIDEINTKLAEEIRTRKLVGDAHSNLYKNISDRLIDLFSIFVYNHTSTSKNADDLSKIRNIHIMGRIEFKNEMDKVKEVEETKGYKKIKK